VLKNIGFGYILGDFFTNSSGHPAFDQNIQVYFNAMAEVSSLRPCLFVLIVNLDGTEPCKFCPGFFYPQRLEAVTRSQMTVFFCLKFVLLPILTAPDGIQ
jgi:hypothetical protein